MKSWTLNIVVRLNVSFEVWFMRYCVFTKWTIRTMINMQIHDQHLVEAFTTNFASLLLFAAKDVSMCFSRSSFFTILLSQIVQATEWGHPG